MQKLSCFFLLVSVLTACMPAASQSGGLQAVTSAPTLDMANVEQLCASAEQSGSSDWQLTIRALEGVYALGGTCPDGRATHLRLYDTYIAYAVQLEAAGRRDDAEAAYRAASNYNRLGEEAVVALRRLNVYTPPPPEPCNDNALNTALAVMPVYTPTTRGFAAVVGQGFYVEGSPYVIHGVNYMPRQTPWQDFLTRTDLVQVGAELDVIAAAGLNTIRIFAQYDALFTCPGSGAVPLAAGFSRLDAVLLAAAARNLRVVVALNDLPDFAIYPLYTSPLHVRLQTEYIVRRYRDEPSIFAWDLRSTWGEEEAGIGRFPRQQILAWLSETAAAVRAIDSQHLITTGWFHDPAASIPLVDYVSVGHRGHADELRRAIVALRAQTDKPVVLADFGYSSYGVPDVVQAVALSSVFRVITNEDLAGWFVWNAFDLLPESACMPLSCPPLDEYDDAYGLWRVDLSAKPGLRVVQGGVQTR